MGTVLFLVSFSAHLHKDSIWYFMCFRYNAFKFGVQKGDSNKQLIAPVHLLCASCAGDSHMHSHMTCKWMHMYRNTHSQSHKSYLGRQDETLSPKHSHYSVTHAVSWPSTSVHYNQLPFYADLVTSVDGLFNLWKYEGLRGMYKVSCVTWEGCQYWGCPSH